MATAVPTRTSWPALSEHKRLRFTTIFGLYVAQGLPIGFFQFAIPAWMAANGAGAAAVGTVVGAASLPWSLKLVHGFLMDRWAYLPMGRRRAWLIAAQLLIVATMLALAATDAAPADVTLLAAFAFVANLFTTVQDVAIDGMAIDLIPDEERGRANGFMFGGQALGMAIGTTLTGFALVLGGMFVAALLSAAIVTLLLGMIIVLRERPGERLMPWTDGVPSSHALDLHAGAWKPILVGTFRATARRDTLIYLAAAFLASSSLGVFYGLSPLLGTGTVGWSDAEVSSLTGSASLVAALVAILVVGLAADRIGAKRCALFICFASAALAAAMLLLSDSWAVPALFVVFVTIFLTLDTAVRTCTCAIAMRLCDPRVGATQFGLFMAAGNLGISTGAALLGTLEDLGGFTAMLVAMGAAQLGALLCLLRARVGR